MGARQDSSGRGWDAEIAQATLDNGLRVVASPDRGSAVAAVYLRYSVGSADEEEGRTGLAHLFEHLMFEGSANVAPGEHTALVQRLGGSVNGLTAFDWTGYHACVPVEHLDTVLWLEADRMGSLIEGLSQEVLDKQRAIVQNERRQRYDNVPFGTAQEELYSRLFPAGHPYHHPPIGSMEDLAAASLDDVRAFFRNHYRPDNAVLSVVGDLEPDEVFERVNHWFGIVPAVAAAGSPPRPSTSLLSLGAGAVTTTSPTSVPACFWVYAMPSQIDPAYAPLKAGFAVLGTGRGSVARREVVKAELASQCTASIHPGLLASLARFAVFGIPGLGVEQAKDVLDTAVRRLVDAGPTDEELARAKAQLRRSWLDRIAAPLGRAALLSDTVATFAGDAAQVAAAYDEEMGVSPEDVQKAFASAFEGARPATVAYEPVGASS